MLVEPITFTALDERTGDTVEDRRRLAATRCFAILTAAVGAIAAHERNLVTGGKRMDDVMDTMSTLVCTMLTHSQGSGAHLQADIDIVAGMLGCRFIAVAETGKGIN